MATRYHLLPPTTAGISSDAVKKDNFLSGLAAQLALDLPIPNTSQMAAIWDAIRPNLEKFTANALKPQEASKAMQQTVTTELQSLNSGQL